MRENNLLGYKSQIRGEINMSTVWLRWLYRLCPVKTNPDIAVEALVHALGERNDLH